MALTVLGVCGRFSGEAVQNFLPTLSSRCTPLPQQGTS